MPEVKAPPAQRDYFATDGINQSSIKDFLRCPYLYQKRHLEKDPDWQYEPTTSMEFGTALDIFVTEGPLIFDKKYLKVKRRSADSQDPRIQLTESLHDEITTIGMWVLKQPIFQQITESLKIQQELFVDIGDDTFKGKLDYFGINVNRTCTIVDLKTTRDADWARFQYDVIEYGYIFQQAWYRMLAKSINPNIKKFKNYIFAIDRTPKHKFIAYEVDQKIINEEMEKIVEILKLKPWNNRQHKPIKGSHFKCPAYGKCPYSLAKEVFKINRNNFYANKKVKV